jgi:hypothetical protein
MHAQIVREGRPGGNGKGSPPITAGTVRDFSGLGNAPNSARAQRRRPPAPTAPSEVHVPGYSAAVIDRRDDTGEADGFAAATVLHGDQQHDLTADDVLTFGRSSSCTISLAPNDLGISRTAGSLEHQSGTWWLRNRSTSRALVAVDDLGIRSIIAPGRRVAVSGRLTVVVEGSARRHALEVRVGRGQDLRRITQAQPSCEEQPTAAAGEVAITSLDHLALVALFSGYLEPFPRYDPHPRSYGDAAAILGWPRTTLTKRIEHLRARLTSAGVPNLVGDNALDHLAEWSLTTRVLSKDDLGLIQK